VEDGGYEIESLENTLNQCDCRDVDFRMGIGVEMEMSAGATGQTLRRATAPSCLLQDRESTSWSLRDAEARCIGMGEI
jgi:hypothetical protein